MKKRTVALTLVLIGPTLIAGCYSRSSTSSRDADCDPDKEDCSNRRGGGYYGGGFYGGGVGRARNGVGRSNSRSGASSAVDSGGFGSTGRSFFRSS